MKKPDIAIEDFALLRHEAEAILEKSLAETSSAISESQAMKRNRESGVRKVKRELQNNNLK